jgi:hypothetical protein
MLDIHACDLGDALTQDLAVGRLAANALIEKKSGSLQLG